jgi:hypothetical protein
MVRPFLRGVSLLSHDLPAKKKIFMMGSPLIQPRKSPAEPNFERPNLCVLLLGGIETIVRSFDFLSFSLSRAVSVFMA